MSNKKSNEKIVNLNTETEIIVESVKEKKKRVIALSKKLIVDLVFMCIISAVFIVAAFVVYFCDLGISESANAALNEFFVMNSGLSTFLKSFGAPALISGLAFILFISYRILESDDRKWLKAVLTIIYLLLAAVILYFNWYHCEAIFTDFGMEQIIRHIMWANSVSCAVCFALYYIVCVHFRKWRMRGDFPITLFMMTFIPVIVIVVFVILCFVVVLVPMLLPGWLIQKSVDADLASRESGEGAYTIRNESGCEETVYSSNGSDFYGSDGSYAGRSSDGGKTLFR